MYKFDTVMMLIINIIKSNSNTGETDERNNRKMP
jgi:hypothetical protein